MRMSEDWTAITPPSSPQGSDKRRKIVHKDNVDETSRESFECMYNLHTIPMFRI